MIVGQEIDVARYIRERLDVRREKLDGVLVYACPVCAESKFRGWVAPVYGTVGCFNDGCEANPRLRGGFLELARRLEGIRTCGETFVAVQARYPGFGEVSVPDTVEKYEDWCKLPDSELLANWKGVEPIRFAKKQWGLTRDTMAEAGLRWCIEGRYFRRIIIPIYLDGNLVSFQARATGKRKPKYLTPATGVECGRPSDALLFGLDRVLRGDEVVLVEGPGDVLRWHQDHARPVAVALLGAELTTEKLALLHKREPYRVIVALDADAPTPPATFVQRLRSWGVSSVLGHWAGGKDAGSGAQLVIDESTGTFGGVVAALLGKGG